MAVRVSRVGFVLSADYWLEFSQQTNASIATKALAMAIHQHKTTRGLLVYSDRGPQFTSDAFQKQLADNKFVQSMRRKGDYWNNAAMESFFGTLK